jgi:hypothetical protein
VPLLVPFSKIFTPGSPTPSNEEVIFPEMDGSWANKPEIVNARKIHTNHVLALNFIILCFVFMGGTKEINQCLRGRH